MSEGKSPLLLLSLSMQISAPCPRKECSGVFHSIYGIICGHIMDNKVAIGGKLEMFDFDRQWWLQVEVWEEMLPIKSEFMHIHDLDNSKTQFF
jgi:hypothetical protein